MNRTYLFIAVSLAATGAFVTYVAFQLDGASIQRHLSLTALLKLLPALPLYVLALVARGYRIAAIARRYESSRIVFFDGFRVATLLALANHILPFRLGEGVFVYLARALVNLRFSESAGMLLILRVYDAIGLVSIGALGLSVLPEAKHWRAGAAALVVVLLLIAARLDVFFSLAAAMCRRARAWTRLLPVALVDFVERLSESSRYCRSPGFVALAFGSSLVIWSSFAAFFGAVLVLFGYRIPAADLLVASAVTNISGFIPASALGSFGPLEAGWTAALTWAGLEPSDAAASGIAMHMAMVASLAVLSLIFVLQLWPKLRASGEQTD